MLFYEKMVTDGGSVIMTPEFCMTILDTTMIPLQTNEAF